MTRNDIKDRSLLKLVLLLALMQVSFSSFGQTKNELSLYMQGSFSKLDYEVLQQKSEMENGFGIGIRYAYFLNEHWSLATGVGMQYLKGSVSLPATGGAYDSQDPEGEAFEFRYRAEGISENQQAYFLDIPLQVQYETGGNIRYYAAGGIKAGIVLDSQFDSQIRSLESSGYYPQYDVELAGPEFAGFGEFGPVKRSGAELELQTNVVLHLENGVKFLLENEKTFYIGLFLDYGLKDIQPKSTDALYLPYDPQDPTSFTTSSVLASRLGTASSPLAEEVKTIAFGLKIGYGLGF